MNQWTVLNSLRLFTAIEGDGAAVLPLCRAAAQEINERMKETADENDPRAVAAAAGEAYYRLMLARISGDESLVSFKAGDVVVTQSATAALELASKVRNETLLNALPVFRDDTFIFTSA